MTSPAFPSKYPPFPHFIPKGGAGWLERIGNGNWIN